MGKRAKERRKAKRIAKAPKFSKVAVDFESTGIVTRGGRRRTSGTYPLPVMEEITAYITGTGQRLLNTHKREARCDEGCVIHNPTDRTGFPTNWKRDQFLMQRVCEHGVGHPDPDHIRWVARRFGLERASKDTQHRCDGCCNPNVPVLEQAFKVEKERRSKSTMRVVSVTSGGKVNLGNPYPFYHSPRQG